MTAAELAHAGQSVVLATGTASGKSLAYLLPVLTDLLEDERATALYLSPTKALATDQLRAVRALNLVQVRTATYDGDTSFEERDWVRRFGSLVLTNPDMLHRGVLPRHADFSRFLRGLRYVVIDECHTYRGVFGSHVAQVLRRLRRVCARYGANPVFVLASATVSEPEVSAGRLTGLPVTAVTDDASPRGATEFALWEPPLTESYGGEHGAPVRRSATAETGDLLADLVVEGARTIAFVRSRRGAEAVALNSRRALSEAAPELAGRVAAYRGRLPARGAARARAAAAVRRPARRGGDQRAGARRRRGRARRGGAVGLAGDGRLGVAAGRSGRPRRPAGAGGVRGPRRPARHLPGAPPGGAVRTGRRDHRARPVQPLRAGAAPVLRRGRAAADRPTTSTLFGEGTEAVLADLVRRGLLRHRPKGWFWTSRERPDADLRGSGGPPVRLVEVGTGRLLGTVDHSSAHSQAHTGAVYLHQGETYVVDDLDLEDAVAMVHAAEPDYSTSARDITDITHRRDAPLDAVPGCGAELRHGGRQPPGGVVPEEAGRLGRGARRGAARPAGAAADDARGLVHGRPPSCWPPPASSGPTCPGAAHAAEHAAIGLLPLFATCDRWDIGGVSTALHQDTGLMTVFVYDGHPGGAGFAERGYRRAGDWLTATREAIAACECATGCPSCVQSPKCGNGNEPLDKAGAVRLLDVVLRSGLGARCLASPRGRPGSGAGGRRASSRIIATARLRRAGPSRRCCRRR